MSRPAKFSRSTFQVYRAEARFFLAGFFFELTKPSADRHSLLAVAAAFRPVLFRSRITVFSNLAIFLMVVRDFVFAEARLVRAATFFCGIVSLL